MCLCRQGYESRTDSVVSLTGRDGVLIHQYFGLRVMLGIVVDGAESRLDPAAFNDALTQGRRIKVTPGLEALHDPNSDQDDRGCKQKQKCDHGHVFRKRDRRLAPSYPSSLTRPSQYEKERSVPRKCSKITHSGERVPSACVTAGDAPCEAVED